MESRVGSRSIDILNADQELLQSRVEALSQREDMIIAAYRVEVTGHMTAADLRLPVKIYDPEEHYNDAATKWFGLADWFST
jgi:hypothetical protein